MSPVAISKASPSTRRSYSPRTDHAPVSHPPIRAGT
jgi:hypothetical protein